MKHLFVPYDLAFKATQAGFNELCLARYNPNYEDNRLQYNGEVNHYLPVNWNDKGYVSAPIYQQLIDWFRGKNLSVEHSTFSDSSVEFCIYKIKELNEVFHCSGEYYMALEMALTKAFKLTQENNRSPHSS